MDAFRDDGPRPSSAAYALFDGLTGQEPLSLGVPARKTEAPVSSPTSSFVTTPQGRQQRLVWVRRLRLAFPALAVLLLGAVVAELAWGALWGVFHQPPAVGDQTVRMVKPAFAGSGRDGSHFSLVALSGVRDAKDDKKIQLDHPRITVNRDAQTGETLTIADHGVFQEDAHTLALSGHVQVQEPGGFRFAANDATIDTNTGQVVGQSVAGNGPTGLVQSNSYAVSQKGDRMVFTGRVRARVNGH